MTRIIPFLLFTILFSVPSFAQTQAGNAAPNSAKAYRYRVTFTDKKGNGFSVRHPEKFLSAKALARRERYGLSVDEYDLPLSPRYIKTLQDKGLTPIVKSKWNNTVVVETSDTTVMQSVRSLSFVSNVRCVWEQPESLPDTSNLPDRHSLLVEQSDTLLDDYYGAGETQVKMLGAEKLHQAGYQGKGVTVAVIDGGFYNADIIKGLPQERILGTRNFVRPALSVYDEPEHGMMVLSCLAARKPHVLVGTAPDASYYLLVSEDCQSEQLIEEDYWCAAVEYADSIGCDIATSSLGYYMFDHPYMDHHYYDLDGQTAINSRSASLAASRGLLLVNSAGNSGDSPWKKIGFPADAKDILTVGAVTALRLNTNFSSVGNTADGRTKPDVMAMGYKSAVFFIDGHITRVNGTSFSCPTMAGVAACLVQAFPTKRPEEIIHMLQQCSSNAAHPDNIFGYGIPNVGTLLAQPATQH